MIGRDCCRCAHYVVFRVCIRRNVVVALVSVRWRCRTTRSIGFRHTAPQTASSNSSCVTLPLRSLVAYLVMSRRRQRRHGMAGDQLPEFKAIRDEVDS